MDDRWVAVDFKPYKSLKKPVSLADIKQTPGPKIWSSPVWAAYLFPGLQKKNTNRY